MRDARHFDAIVIGSGAGGLAAAAILARFKASRVLVLERHYEIGGLTHAFRRGPYSWDVGLHYVGDLEEGSQTRGAIDAVTGGALRWIPMPKDFDCVRLPGLAFDVPADFDRYRERLIKTFPDEAAAIRRYFRDVERASAWLGRDMALRVAPAPVAGPARALNRPAAGPGLETTAVYLDRNFRSPTLKALIAYCWGDYGVPPSRSAFATHALIVNSYRNGAYYPEGGAERFARLAERVIERAGGAILTQTEALEVLIENGRAAGVRARHAPGGAVADYHAPVVVSDAGALATFRTLVPEAAHPGAGALVGRLAEHETGSSAVQVFLGLKGPLEAIGVKGENFWLMDTLDHEALAEGAEPLIEGRPLGAFVSFPSMKAGDRRAPTAEIVQIVAPEPFEAWRGAHPQDRAAGYAEMKARIAEGLIALADRHLPGLRRLIDYVEVATPLTIEHYDARPMGRMYGLAATPRLLASGLVGPRTPVPGLYLAGNDSASLGIVGAVMGGLLAAGAAMGMRDFGAFMRALPKMGRAGPEAPAPRPRRSAQRKDLRPRRAKARALPRCGRDHARPRSRDRPDARAVLQGRGRRRRLARLFDRRLRVEGGAPDDRHETGRPGLGLGARLRGRG